MKTDLEKKLEEAKANPDLVGFDLDALAGLSAYPDGSGGGLRCLAWEMQRLREVKERVALLEAFVRKYQVVLAKLSWSLDDTVSHPTKKEGEDQDLAVWTPQIEINPRAYNKSYNVTAKDIAALWPGVQWRRTLPRWGEETERDYTADVDGVLIRIVKAECLPPVKAVSRFGPCGPVKIG